MRSDGRSGRGIAPRTAHASAIAASALFLVAMPLAAWPDGAACQSSTPSIGAAPCQGDRAVGGDGELDPAVTQGEQSRPRIAPAREGDSAAPSGAATESTASDSTETDGFFERTLHGLSDGLKKQGWVSWHEYRGRCATIHLHTRQMFDFTFFEQDATNIAQVGQASPQFDWREARFYISGRFLCFDPAWSYYVALDYGGFNLPQSQRFGLSEAWLGIPVNDWIGVVEVGKVRQTFSLEALSSGGSMTFMERALEAFYIANMIGLAVRNTALDQRLNWSAGLFYDWLSNGSYFGATARVTGLPLYAQEGALLVHLGASGRYFSTGGSSLDFQARPATHVGPFFADTGSIEASGVWGFDAEALAILGPVTLQAELLENWVISSSASNPTLWGWYVNASWFVTGEIRPYSREKAIPGYVTPRGAWGAVEVAARYWVNDLDGGTLSGGTLRDLQLGVNWYLGALFRVDFNYGHVWLNRFGTVGQSGVYGFRLQLQI